MRFSTILILPTAIISAAIIYLRSINLSLILAFSIEASQDPNSSGSCAGTNNILIPYFYPPDRQEFIEKVNFIIALGNFLGTLVIFNINPLV